MTEKNANEEDTEDQYAEAIAADCDDIPTSIQAVVVKVTIVVYAPLFLLYDKRKR